MLLVDYCRDKQESVFPELLLTAAKEGCPVFFEAGNPLLAELGLY